jgi:hypothetical protein
MSRYDVRKAWHIFVRESPAGGDLSISPQIDGAGTGRADILCEARLRRTASRAASIHKEGGAVYDFISDCRLASAETWRLPRRDQERRYMRQELTREEYERAADRLLRVSAGEEIRKLFCSPHAEIRQTTTL